MCLLIIILCCFLSFRCPFLHRTAGDTERRYHLRYYKTGSCIHETDSKGNCSKNGSHCAFAHGSHDLRSPVYDIRCNMWTSHSCPYVTWSVCFVLLLLTAPFGWIWQRSAGHGNSGWRGFNRRRWRRWTVRAGSEHGPHREDLERGTALARYHRSLINHSPKGCRPLLLFMYEMHPGISLSEAAVVLIIFWCKIHSATQCPQSHYFLAWQ